MRTVGVTSDPQVQPNVPGQDGWLMSFAMLRISIYGPKYAARWSLKISWDESDATSCSLKSQDGADAHELFSSVKQSKCRTCSTATALTPFVFDCSKLVSLYSLYPLSVFCTA